METDRNRSTGNTIIDRTGNYYNCLPTRIASYGVSRRRTADVSIRPSEGRHIGQGTPLIRHKILTAVDRASRPINKRGVMPRQLPAVKESDMEKTQRTIIACFVVLLIAIPVLGYGQTAEDWLMKGHNETDPEKQIECFTKAVRLNPELAEAYTGRGMANNDLGRYDKAIADYTRAIELNPDNAQTYNNRGYSYERLGKYDKAIADFTKAIRIEPHYSSAYNNRGVAYYSLGRIDEALADFDKACKLGYGKGCENYYKIK